MGPFIPTFTRIPLSGINISSNSLDLCSVLLEESYLTFWERKYTNERHYGIMESVGWRNLRELTVGASLMSEMKPGGVRSHPSLCLPVGKCARPSRTEQVLLQGEEGYGLGPCVPLIPASSLDDGRGSPFPLTSPHQTASTVCLCSPCSLSSTCHPWPARRADPFSLSNRHHPLPLCSGVLQSSRGGEGQLWAGTLSHAWP